MARYAYHCPADGDLEVSRPIGTAPSSVPCPVCGGEVRDLPGSKGGAQYCPTCQTGGVLLSG